MPYAPRIATTAYSISAKVYYKWQIANAAITSTLHVPNILVYRSLFDKRLKPHVTLHQPITQILINLAPVHLTYGGYGAELVATCPIDRATPLASNALKGPGKTFRARGELVSAVAKIFR